MLAEINAICTTCRTPFRARPRQSFLGFQTLTCPQHHKVTYPLTRGYRITYWVFVALMVMIVIEAALKGHIAMPGLIGILMIIGLIRDASIRKQVAALRPVPIPRPAVRKPA